jgi:membrane protease YdiL (CAAX protease family)
MKTGDGDELVPTASGRLLLVALVSGAAAGAMIGTATYYAIHFLFSTATASVTTQIIAFEVYVLLTLALAVAFKPAQKAPLGFRFTSLRHLGLAFVAWLGIVASAVMIYLLLSPIAGGLTDSARKILSVATDVKRLQGQPVAAWAIAISRGCLLVPVFEEWLFRGALLEWLRRYFSNLLAIVISAILFAAMHGYPIVMPYAFVTGLFTGWIRIRTGSTLNTVFMHVLNNLVFLYLGFLLLR